MKTRIDTINVTGFQWIFRCLGKLLCRFLHHIVGADDLQCLKRGALFAPHTAATWLAATCGNPPHPKSQVPGLIVSTETKSETSRGALGCRTRYVAAQEPPKVHLPSWCLWLSPPRCLMALGKKHRCQADTEGKCINIVLHVLHDIA